jgi:ElaB/YqjD/DUF883 family membrane-anchored ribosome-binding protein
MKKNTSISHQAEQAESILQDAEELLAATAHVAEEKVIEARRRLSAAVAKGKEAWEVIQSRAAAGAKATDEAIREHPYQALGIALGAGVLVGYLVSRRRH